MKDRPILFNTEMVQAVLDDRKTQTRRVIKPQPDWSGPGDTLKEAWVNGFVNVKCPYGVPGDQLWVRETWRVGAWSEEGEIAVDYKGSERKEWLKVPDDDQFDRLWQQSTDECIKHFGHRDRYTWEPGSSPLRWRPSIHMPRWVSRIQLEITDVRVERVQDITLEDIISEGAYKWCESSDEDYSEPYMAWEELWDSINKSRGFGWDENPWVWVVEFMRVQP